MKSPTSSNNIEDNEVDESNEELLAIDAGFDVGDVKRELNQVNYLSYLSNEDKNFEIS